MKEPRDRSAEVMVRSGRLVVARNDWCDAFEQDDGRLFSCRECWYCKYGDFGIFTEHPTQNGLCIYKTTMNSTLDSLAKQCVCDLNVQANEKKEEEK